MQKKEIIGGAARQSDKKTGQEGTPPVPVEDLVKKARAYATEQHKRIDQRRKYSNKPYNVHLKAVTDIVASVTDDREMTRRSATLDR